MPGYQEQQVLQQLLSGINTMQMQAGLMPGGIPAAYPTNAFVPPPVMTPGQFSNHLQVQFQRTFAPYPVTPPMFGGVTPVPRPANADYLPPAQMGGGGWGMARQTAQRQAAQSLTSVEGLADFGGGLAASAFGTGIGAKLGAATGFAFGGPVGGVVGGLAGMALLGGPMGSLAQMPFQPFIDQRTRAIQLQNLSMQNVRTGADLSASGIGLSNFAAQNLERNLIRMADSTQFRQDTGQMFNRQDMMKITAASAQLGLLDNTQTVEQMSREMGKIGRALATFMKVIEEPDVLKAVQMMGNLRNMGMAVPEMNVAAQNARVYARMAGTTVQGVMQAGMQGADMFRQLGMSGAAGVNVGMAAAGAAGNFATWMGPRQLELLGGRQGVQSAFMAGAAQMSNLDVFLPGLATMHGGQLEIDPNAIRRLASGQGGITSLVRESARRMQGMGPRGFIEAYSTQRDELRDQFMSELGGEAGTLLPLIQARHLVETGAVQSIGAGLRLLGMDERQARTLELSYQSEDFWRQKREAFRPNEFEAQGRRARESQAIQARSSEAFRRRVGTGLARVGLGVTAAAVGGIAAVAVAPLAGVTTALVGGVAAGAAYGIAGDPFADLAAGARGLRRAGERFFGEDAAVEADIEEQRLVAGGGDLLRAARPDRYLSPEQIKQAREIAKVPTITGAGRQLLTRVDELRRQEASDAQAYAGLPFMGPEGFRFRNRGKYLSEIAYENQGTANTFGMFARTLLNMSPRGDLSFREPERVETLLNQQSELGRMISESQEQGGTAENLLPLIERMQAVGIDRRGLARIIAKGARGVQAYAKEKEGLFGVGEATPAEITAAMTNAIESDLKGKGISLTPELRNEILRAAQLGGDETVNAVLDTFKTRGQTVDQARKGQDVALARQAFEESGQRTLSALGLSGTDTGSAEGRALLNLFGETGEDAEIKKKLFAIKALRASGSKGADEEASLLEMELNTDPKIKKKLEGLRGTVAAELEGVSRETLGKAGTQLAKRFAVRDKEGKIIPGKFQEADVGRVLGRATEEAQERLRDMPTVALIERFGLDFARAYKGEQTVEARRAFVQEKLKDKEFRDKLEPHELEQLERDPYTLERITLERFKGDSRAFVEGGGPAPPDAETGGMNETTRAAVDVLERWSKEDRAKADAAYDKLHQAADKLLNDADIMKARRTAAKATESEPTLIDQITGSTAMRIANSFFK